jgi:hypothetical protein
LKIERNSRVSELSAKVGWVVRDNLDPCNLSQKWKQSKIPSANIQFWQNYICYQCPIYMLQKSPFLDAFELTITKVCPHCSSLQPLLFLSSYLLPIAFPKDLCLVIKHFYLFLLPVLFSFLSPGGTSREITLNELYRCLLSVLSIGIQPQLQPHILIPT